MSHCIFIHSLCVENLWLILCWIHSFLPPPSHITSPFSLFTHSAPSFVSIDWHSLVLMDFHASVDTIVASSSSGSSPVATWVFWLLVLVCCSNFYSKTYLQRKEREGKQAWEEWKIALKFQFQFPVVVGKFCFISFSFFNFLHRDSKYKHKELNYQNINFIKNLIARDYQ